MPYDPNNGAAGNAIQGLSALVGLRNFIATMPQTKAANTIAGNNAALSGQSVELGKNNVVLNSLAMKQALNRQAMQSFMPAPTSSQNPPPDTSDSGGSALPPVSLPPDGYKLPASGQPWSQSDTNAFGAELQKNVAAGAPNPMGANPPPGPAAPPPPDYSRSLFSQMPPDAQQDVLAQYKGAVPHPEAFDPQEAIAAHDSKVQASSIPPLSTQILSNPNLTISDASVGPGGPSANFKARYNVAQPVLAPGGQPTGKITVNGQTMDDPNFQAPAAINTQIDDLQNLQATQQQALVVQKLLDENPNLVGKGIISGGSGLPSAIAEAKAYAGHPDTFNNQQTIRKFLTGQLLNSLGQLHLGRMTEMEFNKIQQGKPTMEDSKSTFDSYFKTYMKGLNQEIAQRQKTLAPYVTGQQLPDVDMTAPQVQAPTPTTPDNGLQSGPISNGTTGEGDGTVPGSTQTTQQYRTVGPAQLNTVKRGETVWYDDPRNGKPILITK